MQKEHLFFVWVYLSGYSVSFCLTIYLSRRRTRSFNIQPLYLSIYLSIYMFDPGVDLAGGNKEEDTEWSVLTYNLAVVKFQQRHILQVLDLLYKEDDRK